MDRYDLIESFPSSYAKYEVGLIAETLERTNMNPCQVLYDKQDLKENVGTEDLIEELAFNKSDKLQLFLDAKNAYFNSRRIESKKLAKYLKKKYNYDPPKIAEFDDDKNALFIMLFNETYNPKRNEIDHEMFVEARTAAYKFKDRRDRMATIDKQFDLTEIIEKIPHFMDIMRSDAQDTIANWYHNKDRQTLTVLLRQEEGRSVEPRISETDEDNPSLQVNYIDNYPVRENAIKISNETDYSEIQSYSSVSTWEDTLMRFFTSTMDDNYTESLEARSSVKAKEIVEEVKENTNDEDSPDVAGSEVESIVTENIEDELDDIDQDESEISEELIKSRLNNLIVTGVYVDGEETTFEIHADNGIKQILDEYDGMAASLAEAVKHAKVDDITIHARIENEATEDDDIVLENGEWYLSGSGNEATIKALEAVL